MIKDSKRHVVRAIFFLVFALLFVMISNPLRRSNDHIRESVLRITPVGMSMENVIYAIKSNEKWSLTFVDNEAGYSILERYPSGASGHKMDAVIGEKSIKACIGEYGAVFETSVVVFWGFDEDSHLIDIAVMKEVNSL